MLSSQLRDQVHEFIDSHMTTRELEDWIVPRLEYYLQNPHTRDAELVAAVELGLVELGQGIATEGDLRADLREFMQHDVSILVQTRGSGTMATTSSVNRLLPTQPIQQQSANTPLILLPS